MKIKEITPQMDAQEILDIVSHELEEKYRLMKGGKKKKNE